MKKLYTNKATRRILRGVLILLSISLFTTGCGHKQETKFEKGFGFNSRPLPIMIGVKSDTDTFAKDDVTLDLYYGVHDIEYNEKYNTDPKWSYQTEGNETVFFGLYICEGDHSLDVLNGEEIPDYKMIDHHYFIREISEEEAFSGEYGFTMGFWKGITYNHSEKVIIPSEFFTEKSGSFAVKIIAFQEPITEGDNYYTSNANHCLVEYELIDENTIRIAKYI